VLLHEIPTVYVEGQHWCRLEHVHFLFIILFIHNDLLVSDENFVERGARDNVIDSRHMLPSSVCKSSSWLSCLKIIKLCYTISAACNEALSTLQINTCNFVSIFGTLVLGHFYFSQFEKQYRFVYLEGFMV